MRHSAVDPLHAQRLRLSGERVRQPGARATEPDTDVSIAQRVQVVPRPVGVQPRRQRQHVRADVPPTARAPRDDPMSRENPSVSSEHARAPSPRSSAR